MHFSSLITVTQGMVDQMLYSFRAKKALSAVAERASKELVNPLQLEFGGVGNFGNSVVFVKMKEGEEMKRLLLLSGECRSN